MRGSACCTLRSEHRDLLGARAWRSRPVHHEAASARMLDPYQAKPRVEIRTHFGHIPLFRPSSDVLRDTGMMRSTSGHVTGRPVKCNAAGTFGAEPMVTPEGVEFILRVSPRNTAVAPSGLLFAGHPKPRRCPISRAAVRHHPHRPGCPVRMRLRRHRIDFDLADFTKFAGPCLDTWLVWRHLVLTFLSASPTRPAQHATTLHATADAL